MSPRQISSHAKIVIMTQILLQEKGISAKREVLILREISEYDLVC